MCLAIMAEGSIIFKKKSFVPGNEESTCICKEERKHSIIK